MVMKLMAACELAVQLDGAELPPDGGYLVAEKLRLAPHVELDDPIELRCEFLGEGVLPRFIGRMRKQIEAENGEPYMFRNKVRVHLPGNPRVRALVVADVEQSRVLVKLDGGTNLEQMELLGEIKAELRRYVELGERPVMRVRNKGGAPPIDKTDADQKRAGRIYEAWKALGTAKNKPERLSKEFGLPERDIKQIYERERKRRERKGNGE
jgi:hypothetical protein